MFQVSRFQVLGFENLLNGWTQVFPYPKWMDQIQMLEPMLDLDTGSNSSTINKYIRALTWVSWAQIQPADGLYNSLSRVRCSPIICPGPHGSVIWAFHLFGLGTGGGLQFAHAL